ncbi:MAG TPA: CDP-diacylglycerol--glycerol-3-phosphate 3-phosphatidyltransferase [Candidatus Enterenecus stercoripullorum]|nr:CDP-diacylglycerol--glycerol-3-phosphate 3-phosphatidyltransferase [Candidatus Enterenecus stercoripullorum]
MNTANKLTMLRVALIPVYLVVLYWGFPGAAYVALAIFVIASLTDFVDGYIARHYNQTTDFGKFMDPLADKVLVLSSMLWFCSVGRLPAWALVIVVAREFAVSGLRLVAVDNGRVIAAAWSGKVKTFSTMVCLCLMHLPVPSEVDYVCVAVIAATTLYSGVEYFVKNKDVLNWNK